MAVALRDLTNPLAQVAARLDNEPELTHGLNNIIDQGRRIGQNIVVAMETKGGQLLGLITSLVSARFPDSAKLDRLTTSLSETKRFFQSTKNEVISMQISTQGQIEPCRGRRQTKEVEIDEKNASIVSIQGQITGLNQNISTWESDINSLNQTAGELDEMGHRAKRAGKRRKKRGLIGAVAGVALAPFTGGASLVVGGVFAGANISNAEDCFSKASNLRSEAATKRANADKLKAELETLTQDKNRMQAEITGLEGEKEKLSAACKALNDVTACLLSTSKQLERVIDNLQDVELAVQDAKMHGETFNTFKAAFSNTMPPERTEKYAEQLKTKWRCLEQILTENGVRAIAQ